MPGIFSAGCLHAKAVLGTKLTEVVIHMEVGPTEPGGLRHPAEYRMHLPVKTPGIRGDDLQQRLELRYVGCKVDRPRTSNLLIDLRPCENSGRPRQWKVEDNPFDDRPLKPAGSKTHGLFTCRHPKGVV